MQCWLFGHLYEGHGELILHIYTYRLVTNLPRRAIQKSLRNGGQCNAQLGYLWNQSEFSQKHNDTRAVYFSKWLFSPGVYLVEFNLCYQHGVFI